MFRYNVISHHSSYYFKMCISEITKKKKKLVWLMKWFNSETIIDQGKWNHKRVSAWSVMVSLGQIFQSAHSHQHKVKAPERKSCNRVNSEEDSLSRTPVWKATLRANVQNIWFHTTGLVWKEAVSPGKPNQHHGFQVGLRGAASSQSASVWMEIVTWWVASSLKWGS